ncbi:hypothetical protein BsWGS_08844 [Bradybaena similaris]
MSSSRFSHFHESTDPDFNDDDGSMDTQDNNNTSNGDTMVIKAGIRFKSPANTASFNTTVFNGHDNPCVVTATVTRPSSDGTNNGKEVITYNNLKQGEHENGVIGSVSFNGNGTAIKNGWFAGFQDRIYQCNSVKVPLLNPLKPFQITVRNHLTSGTYLFSVVCTTTVDELKTLIKDKIGMQPEEQHLVFAGKNLASGMTMEYYSIKEGSQVLLTGRLRGG